MAESINRRTNAMANMSDAKEVAALFKAIQADNTAVRAAMTVLLAKLDADTGVNDVNYTALASPAASTIVT